MVDRFNFDKEFQEKLNVINETAYRYYKIKAEHDEATEKLHLLLNKQKENYKGENKE